ncbi:tyrosine-type recombinase/integrase [Aquimarina sp. 2201CG14-23]|uniref:tyrosine-type recombinase/integrase n=1 Tax=Aquimarina mycalae TaxID=3040073 RepID=UPI002477CE86|nr:site-specific integrase [Aquimarina sp. 2201CG14-23]MDH7448425.1 site-specific integrase [Aquimarina sp. 2201CG14-23]
MGQIHRNLQFMEWCENKDYHPTDIDYKSCLEYVKKLQEIRNGKRVTQSTVKHKVGALKIYFNYLIALELRFDNPIENVNIRGVRRTLNHNLLEFAELEDLYYSYSTHNIEFPSSPSVAIRNKVITGFIVYQGMNTTALKSLKVDHIHIEKGIVYIPGTRKTNGRTLELKSWQILPLVQYLEKHREIIQEEIQNYSQALFPLNSDRFDIITVQLYKKLKLINHKVVSPKQIRASVITYWLSQYNIREVQYMAGHRYISSTERYLQDDLENLQEVIESLHPII